MLQRPAAETYFKVRKEQRSLHPKVEVANVAGAAEVETAAASAAVFSKKELLISQAFEVGPKQHVETAAVLPREVSSSTASKPRGSSGSLHAISHEAALRLRANLYIRMVGACIFPWSNRVFAILCAVSFLLAPRRGGFIELISWLTVSMSLYVGLIIWAVIHPAVMSQRHVVVSKDSKTNVWNIVTFPYRRWLRIGGSPKKRLYAICFLWYISVRLAFVVFEIIKKILEFSPRAPLSWSKGPLFLAMSLNFLELLISGNFSFSSNKKNEQQSLLRSSILTGNLLTTAFSLIGVSAVKYCVYRVDKNLVFTGDNFISAWFDPPQLPWGFTRNVSPNNIFASLYSFILQIFLLFVSPLCSCLCLRYLLRRSSAAIHSDLFPEGVEELTILLCGSGMLDEACVLTRMEDIVKNARERLQGQQGWRSLLPEEDQTRSRGSTCNVFDPFAESGNQYVKESLEKPMETIRALLEGGKVSLAGTLGTRMWCLPLYTLSRLFGRALFRMHLLSPQVLHAIHVACLESALDSTCAALLAFGTCSITFNQVPCCLLTRSRLAVSCGKPLDPLIYNEDDDTKRPQLTIRACHLFLKDTVFLCLSRRLAQLAEGLNLCLQITDAICITPPTGVSFALQGGSMSATQSATYRLPSNAKQFGGRTLVYRFDPRVFVAVSEAIGAIKPTIEDSKQSSFGIAMEKFTTEFPTLSIFSTHLTLATISKATNDQQNLFVIFGDGSIGISYIQLNKLISEIQDLLSPLVDLVLSYLTVCAEILEVRNTEARMIAAQLELGGSSLQHQGVTDENVRHPISATLEKMFPSLKKTIKYPQGSGGLYSDAECSPEKVLADSLVADLVPSIWFMRKLMDAPLVKGCCKVAETLQERLRKAQKEMTTLAKSILITNHNTTQIKVNTDIDRANFDKILEEISHS